MAYAPDQDWELIADERDSNTQSVIQCNPGLQRVVRQWPCRWRGELEFISKIHFEPFILHDIIPLYSVTKPLDLYLDLLERHAKKTTGLSIIYLHTSDSSNETWNHIHVIHDCKWTSNKCNHALLSGVRIKPRNTPKAITRSTECSTEYFRNLLHYFDYKRRGVLHFKICNTSEGRTLDGAKNLSSDCIESNGEIWEMGTRDCQHCFLRDIRGKPSYYDGLVCSSDCDGSSELHAEIKEGCGEQSSELPQQSDNRISLSEKAKQYLMSNVFCPVENCVQNFEFVNKFQKLLSVQNKSHLDSIFHWINTYVANMSFRELELWLTNNNPKHKIESLKFKVCKDNINFSDYYLSMTDTKQLIDSWLLFQCQHDEEKVKLFLQSLYNILNCNNGKKNVLYLFGPSNCLKSTFIGMIAEASINVGYCNKANKYAQFGFQNMYNRRLVIIDDPSFDPLALEQCKDLFSGDSTNIQVKYQGDKTVIFTPILMASNTEMFKQEVWYNRIVRLQCNQPILDQDVPATMKKPHPLYTFQMFRDWDIGYFNVNNMQI